MAGLQPIMFSKEYFPWISFLSRTFSALDSFNLALVEVKSRYILRIRSIDRTRANNSKVLKGLVIKSSAPESNPFTRSSISAKAVTMITGIYRVLGLVLIFFTTSNPSILGRMISSKTRSGGEF